MVKINISHVSVTLSVWGRSLPSIALRSILVVLSLLTVFQSGAAAYDCTGCPLPTFESTEIYQTDSYLGRIVAGDFNNDGRDDLALTKYEDTQSGGSQHLMVFLGNGGGQFESPISNNIFVRSRPPTYGRPIATADFDHDGDLDVVIDGGECIVIAYGQGTGHFDEGRLFCGLFADETLALAVGDFDHDNNPDVAALHSHQGPSITIWFGDGAAVEESPVEVLYGEVYLDQSSGLALGDFNGDNNLDIVGYVDDITKVLLGNGERNFTLADSDGVNRSMSYAVGDYDADGKLDFATPYSAYLGDGTGTFHEGLRFSDSDVDSPEMIRTADLNSDGNLDLVRGYEGNLISIWLGDGSGWFGSLRTFPDVGYSIAFGDFNGDGRPDVAAVGSIYQSKKFISVMLNTTYQTPIGPNSSVIVNNTTFTFDNVTGGGTTTLTPIDPASIGQVPGGFAVSSSVAYEIATTASFTGSVKLAFKVPDPISEADFNTLAILHNVNGTLVDVTATTPARDYPTRTIYATTNSFSPFYLARRGPHIKTLFDQTKAYKSGSTIPIKLQVLDASNGNLSSASTALVARDLRLMSQNTTAPVVDSGNANPDYSFRYDATLGGTGGGYIFNLSTKGLASGQYVLSFYVGNERSFFYTVKFEVK